MNNEPLTNREKKLIEEAKRQSEKSAIDYVNNLMFIGIIALAVILIFQKYF